MLLLLNVDEEGTPMSGENLNFDDKDEDLLFIFIFSIPEFFSILAFV